MKIHDLIKVPPGTICRAKPWKGWRICLRTEHSMEEGIRNALPHLTEEEVKWLYDVGFLCQPHNCVYRCAVWLAEDN